MRRCTEVVKEAEEVGERMRVRREMRRLEHELLRRRSWM
jgi:hypothetical protein